LKGTEHFLSSCFHFDIEKNKQSLVLIFVWKIKLNHGVS